MAGRPGMACVATDAGRTQAIARCLLHLRRNRVALAAADGRHGERTFRARLLDRDIVMFHGCAELAQMSGAASFYFSASWAAVDRIRVALQAIRPDGGSSADPQWLRRWNAAYLQCVALQIVSWPADLGFSGGLWRIDLPGTLPWFAPEGRGDAVRPAGGPEVALGPPGG
jgi:hypothetical protein